MKGANELSARCSRCDNLSHDIIMIYRYLARCRIHNKF